MKVTTVKAIQKINYLTEEYFFFYKNIVLTQKKLFLQEKKKLLNVALPHQFND